jgi:hypothetical protein
LEEKKTNFVWIKSLNSSTKFLVSLYRLFNGLQEVQMKTMKIVLVICLALGLALPAMAGVGTGLSGAHWNLNFIGVSKDKTVPTMTNGGRHTIFVPLNSG